MFFLIFRIFAMRYSVFLTFFFLIISLLIFPAKTGQAESSNFRLCVVNERPGQPDLALSQYAGLHACLKKQLAEKNVRVEPLVIAKSISDLVAKIRNGKVDAFIEGVMPTLEVERTTGVVDPQLLVWRKGQREYQTVFFVRRESDVKKLTDLKGQSLVFESPRSTSAYYIPRIILTAMGLQTVPVQKNKSPEEIHFLFAGSEINQAYWVQRGKVHAGAFNDGDWERTPPKIRDQLRIIHRTSPVLRWLFSFHKDVPSDLRNTVIETLTHIHQTKTGKESLRKAERIALFEKLSPKDRNNLDYWRKLLKNTEI